MGGTRRWRCSRWCRAAGLVALAAVASVAAGCSSGAAPDAATSRPVANGGPAAEPGAASAPAGSPASVDAVGAQPQEVGRAIVSTATMSVTVDDVAGAVVRARSTVESAGGVVFAEQTSASTKPVSTLTFKLPPDRFDQTLHDLAGLGKLSSQEVRTDDVTQQVVDLDARIAAAEASVARVEDLTSKTGSVAELTQLDGEVQRRQADLESLRGQKRTLDGRTDQATIVLTLSREDAPPVATEQPLPTFTDGLRGGWRAFAAAATVTGAVVGALLPFSWVVVLAVVAVVAARRRARARLSTALAATPTDLPPPPA